MHTEYERIMSEWLAVEAIIRQRDKEVIAANLAKLSQVIRLVSIMINNKIALF